MLELIADLYSALLTIFTRPAQLTDEDLSATDEGLESFLRGFVNGHRADGVRRTSQHTLALRKATASCLIERGGRHMRGGDDDSVELATLWSGAVLRRGDWVFRVAGPRRDARPLTTLLVTELASLGADDQGGLSS